MKEGQTMIFTRVLDEAESLEFTKAIEAAGFEAKQAVRDFVHAAASGDIDLLSKCLDRIDDRESGISVLPPGPSDPFAWARLVDAKDARPNRTGRPPFNTWVSSHVRGDEKLGVVDKIYQMKLR